MKKTNLIALDTNKLATPEQLAEKKSIEIAIQDHIKKINYPYSTIASMFVFPLLVETMLNENINPFYSGIASLMYQSTVAMLSNNNALSQRIVNIYIRDVNKGVKAIFDEVYKIQLHTLKLLQQQTSDHNLDFDLHLANADALLKDPSFDKPAGLKQIMQLTMQGYNLCVGDKSKYLDENTPDQYSFRYLFNFIKDPNANCQQNKAALINQFAEQLLTNGLIGIYANIIKIPLFIAGRVLILEPLIMKIAPNGVFQTPKPASKKTPWLTQKQAEQELTALKEHCDALAKIAQRNTKIARQLTVILICISVFFFLQGDLETIFSHQYLMLMYAFAATALSNLVKDAKAAYASYYLESNLQDQLNTINAIFNNEKYINTYLIKKETLDSSLIKIYSKDKFLLELIKGCFISNKIEIIADDETEFSISAAIFLSKTIVNNLKTKFQTGLHRKQTINDLKKQFTQLAQILQLEFIYMSGFDPLHLPISRFELAFSSTTITGELITQIKDLFTANKIEIIENSHMKILVMTGHAPAVAETFNSLLKSINSTKQDKSKEPNTNFYGTFLNSNPSSNKTQKKPKVQQHKEKEKDKDKKTNSKAQPVAVEAVERYESWPSGAVYDSTNPHCKVYPLNESGIFDNRFLQKARSFITNELDPLQFANDKLYKGIADIIENSPHVGSSIVYDSGHARDNKGNLFIYSLKIRPKGDHDAKGDLRGFAIAERNEQRGTVLYRVIGLGTH